MKYLIYLHGFASSPVLSKKATVLEEMISHRENIEFLAPHLTEDSYYPVDIGKNLVAMINELIKVTPPNIGLSDIFLVANSLGGYFAIYLSERFNLKTVLVNPAVKPYNFLHYKGSHTDPTTGKTFELTDIHFSQLYDIEVADICCPENFFLLLNEDDEIIDYTQALAKFPSSRHLLLPTGGHAFPDFAHFIGDMFAFLNI